MWRRYILYGASPRASINLILTARALAYLRGRSYVLAQDIRDMVLDVVRHRLILSYEALSDNVTSDMILARVLDQVLAPAQPLREHVSSMFRRKATPRRPIPHPSTPRPLSASCSGSIGR